jgi:hypothetical protein
VEGGETPLEERVTEGASVGDGGVRQRVDRLELDAESGGRGINMCERAQML